MRKQLGTFGTLDGIRGLAALLIAMRHTEIFFAPLSFSESFLAVDLFFVLSGVVVCRAYEAKLLSGLSVGQFTWIRIVRIYPLYLFGTVLAVIAAIVQGDGLTGQLLAETALALFLIPDLAATMLFPLNGPAWSLFFEIVANVAYAACLRLLSLKRLAIVIAVAGCMVAVLVFIGQRHSLDIGWTARSFVAGFPRVAFSFGAGVAIYRLYASQTAAPWFARHAARPVAPVLILAAVGVILTASPAPAVQPYFELFVAGAVFPVLIYLSLFSQPRGLLGTTCRVAGLISYPLYAIHAPIGKLAEDAFGSGIAAHAPWIGIPFAAALGVLCVVLNRVFDTPVRRFMLGLRQRSNPLPAAKPVTRPQL